MVSARRLPAKGVHRPDKGPVPDRLRKVVACRGHLRFLRGEHKMVVQMCKTNLPREVAVIDAELVKMLVCPETLTPLRPVEDAVLYRLNRAIAHGALKTRAGRILDQPLEGGLVRLDGAVLYPVVEDIPLLLVDEGIELAQVVSVCE